MVMVKKKNMTNTSEFYKLKNTLKESNFNNLQATCINFKIPITVTL